MSGLSRRQFAAQIGKSVGYVQKLVDTGRCVLTPAGKIDDVSVDGLTGPMAQVGSQMKDSSGCSARDLNKVSRP